MSTNSECAPAGQAILSPEQLFKTPFASLPQLIAAHAAERPNHPALVVEGRTVPYAELEALSARVAAALQRDGTKPGDRVATIGSAGIEHLVALLGALRAGAAVAPLPGLAHPDQLARMIKDVSPTHVFIDAQHESLAIGARVRWVGLEADRFSAWLSADPAAIRL